MVQERNSIDPVAQWAEPGIRKSPDRVSIPAVPAFLDPPHGAVSRIRTYATVGAAPIVLPTLRSEGSQEPEEVPCVTL